jgi:hypothetical protein
MRVVPLNPALRRGLCLVAFALVGRAGAQDLAVRPPESLVAPLRVPLQLFGPGRDGDAGRAARPRLIGLPNSFFSAPVERAGATPGDEEGGDATDDFAGLQVAFGNHNPFFELRHPGDPGGVGYSKLQSQYQLFDLGAGSISLGLQAVTPSGLQAGGLQNGTTYVMPTVAWFRDLGAGTALQGYVGQNIQANARWADNLDSGFQYGMAIQTPVPGTLCEGDQGVFLFLQALGRYRSDALRQDGRPVLWEFVPGVQWRLNPNCWMSVGASRYNFLNCAWQY